MMFYCSMKYYLYIKNCFLIIKKYNQNLLVLTLKALMTQSLNKNKMYAKLILKAKIKSRSKCMRIELEHLIMTSHLYFELCWLKCRTLNT